MKVIIAGGRDFNNGQMVIDAVKEFKSEYEEITEVVCGMANGADSMGWNYARIWNIPIKEFPADWSTHGKKAGYLRNRDMANYAQGLIAFWDGKSKGTKMMIELATERGLKILIMRY